MSLNPVNVGQKVELIVEHFRKNVAHLLGGQAKAMVVTSSRAAAVFSIKVGTRRWNSALGGTDTLYFLMSYHYGLLSLSATPGYHYPGLTIIDLPGDFLGESVEDKENFIVQPFIDLLGQKAYAGAQVIITGASFQGLEGVYRNKLTKPYVG